MELSEDKLRWLAAIIIVMIFVAYMGWLVITYMEQRETGISIRRSLIDIADKWTPPAQTVESEVVSES